MTVYAYLSVAGNEVLTVTDQTPDQVHRAFMNSRTPLIRVVPPEQYPAELAAAERRLPYATGGIRYDLDLVVKALRAAIG